MSWPTSAAKAKRRKLSSNSNNNSRWHNNNRSLPRKPCLLLVPGLGTDWRWLRERTDSPWYPRHQLFVGHTDGGWDDAVRALVVEAKKRAEGEDADKQQSMR